MNRSIAAAGLIALIGLPEGAEACGRCRRGHARPARAVAMAPAVAPPVAASPQMVQASQAMPTATPAPAPAPAAPVVVEAETGVQPLYRYAAADQTRPAYYYTYDESGKLIVSQWVDFLFRGGKAEGMPRPPLPVIGRFGNRD